MRLMQRLYKKLPYMRELTQIPDTCWFGATVIRGDTMIERRLLKESRRIHSCKEAT